MSEGALVLAIWGSVAIVTTLILGIGLIIYLDLRDRR
jgi:hypothetical protein